MTELRGLLADQFLSRVARTAAELRGIANSIETEAKNITRVPDGGATSGAAVAGRITHTLMWGLANAGLDGIVSSAAEYDFHMAGHRTDLDKET